MVVEAIVKMNVDTHVMRLSINYCSEGKTTMRGVRGKGLEPYKSHLKRLIARMTSSSTM